MRSACAWHAFAYRHTSSVTRRCQLLANLPKWTGDASNITGLARRRSASAETGSWESDPAAEAEAAYLNGSATDLQPDAITQPGEQLRVYNLAGYGEPLQQSEVLISSKSLATEAAALAYMRRGTHDVRPSLLLLMQAQDLDQISKCRQYAHNYLRQWCVRHGCRYSETVLSSAATDGLATFYRLREARRPRSSTPALATPPTRARAKSLHLRDDHYGQLRRVAVHALQARYLEALIDFARAVGIERESWVDRRCTGSRPSDRVDMPEASRYQEAA